MPYRFSKPKPCGCGRFVRRTEFGTPAVQLPAWSSVPLSPWTPRRQKLWRSPARSPVPRLHGGAEVNPIKLTPTMTPVGTATALAAVLAIALAGCVTTTVVMKNPKTGQVQVCQRPPFGSHDAATACAEALKRDGWIELGRD